jgi:hypothetical protein
MMPDANHMYGLDNNLKDRDGNEWTPFSGDVTLQLGDHVILSSVVNGRDACQPGVITNVPRPGGRRRNYKVSVDGKNAGCSPDLLAFYRRGDGNVPDDAISRVPHLSKGKWIKVAGMPPRLQYGQAVKVASRRKRLNGSTGIFNRMKVTKAAIQVGDDMWSIPPVAITEYQEMT